MSHKKNNTRIVANALLKGSVEYVWLKNSDGRPVRVLKESLHKDETKFLSRRNEVDFDSTRHIKANSPLPGGDSGVGK